MESDIPFIDSLRDAPIIKKRELKVNEEYQFKFGENDSVYALTGQYLNTLIITYIRSGVYFFKIKGYEDAKEFHFEENSYMAHCLINGIV